MRYSDILTKEILQDVCEKVTGCSDFTVDFVEEGEYNKGRLATLEYQGITTYVSFSETGDISARNSFFQSLTTALIKYHEEPNTKKRICYYFLPLNGSIETNYFKLMYRLMATTGIEFLNANSFLTNEIAPFTTVDDMIMVRNSNRSRNRSNNSTYLTRSADKKIQIFCKTYGANKKEAVLLCIALSHITAAQIELYEICENNLTELPRPDLNFIRSLGNVEIIKTDLTLERNEFEKDDSLRSPSFIYNLFEKFGPKKCAFCGCEIPELIEGAHIWPVSNIKRMQNISLNLKIQHATNGDNGIWLCANHHKMLDEDLVKISYNGDIEYKVDIEEESLKFIEETTPVKKLADEIITENFIVYLQKRYAA